MKSFTFNYKQAKDLYLGLQTEINNSKLRLDLQLELVKNHRKLRAELIDIDTLINNKLDEIKRLPEDEDRSAKVIEKNDEIKHLLDTFQLTIDLIPFDLQKVKKDTVVTPEIGRAHV